MKTLQFSQDQCVRPEWFNTFEYSIFGKHNSLNLMAIDRKDETYDLVICNHVLEHVEDDHKAVSELLRILKPNGVLQFSVPDPLYLQSKTKDWGFADPKQWYHYRMYGWDILDCLAEPLTNAYVLSIIGVDAPTGRKEIVYWVSKNEERLQLLQSYLNKQPVNPDVEALLQSKSWRVTAPLRTIMHALHKTLKKFQ